MSLFVLTGAGCSSTTRSSILPAQPATPTANSGYSGYLGATIPTSFPADIPRYPNAKTVAATSVYGVATLVQDTHTTPSDVIAWVKTQFTTMGASKSDEGDEPHGGKSFTYEKEGFVFHARIDVSADGQALLTITKESR